MNGVSALTSYRGWPATAIVRLSSERALPSTARQPPGSETILAGVAHPPRGGEPRPIADLVPQVLARYGLSSDSAIEPEIDVLA